MSETLIGIYIFVIQYAEYIFPALVVLGLISYFFGLDSMISAIALAAFAASMGVIVVWVPDVDLAIVCIFAVLLAAYDFWLSAFRSVRSRNDAAAPRD